MPKKNKPTDDQIETMRQQYEVEIAKLKAASGEDREARGVLKKVQMDRAYNDLIEAITLYKIKESKAYQDEGLTWDQFCELLGYERRTVDNILNDIKPIYLRFSENVSVFAKVEFNKIRLLGRTFSENLSGIKDDLINYDGEQYPITPEGVAAVIDAIHDTHKRHIDDNEKDHAKEINKKDKELHLQKTTADFYEDQLKVYKKFIPDVGKGSESRQQFQALKSLYDALIRSWRGLDLQSVYLDDPSVISDLKGLIGALHSDFMRLGNQIEKIERGE